VGEFNNELHTFDEIAADYFEEFAVLPSTMRL
jgi:hypothetical protein